MANDWRSLRFQHVRPDKGRIKTERWPAGRASSDRSFEDDASATYNINVNDVDTMVSARISVAHLTTVLAVLVCSLKSTIADQQCVTKVVEMVGNRCASGGYRARRNLPEVLPKIGSRAGEDEVWRYHNLARKIPRRFARSQYTYLQERSFLEASDKNLGMDLTNNEVDRVYSMNRRSRSSGANPNDFTDSIIDAAIRCCKDDRDCEHIHSIIPCP